MILPRLHRLAGFAATLWPRLATVTAGIARTARTTASFTPATTATPWLRPDGALPLPARRIALLLETRRARDMRQSKLAAALESDLRAVTHQMLAIHLNRER